MRFRRRENRNWISASIDFLIGFPLFFLQTQNKEISQITFLFSSDSSPPSWWEKKSSNLGLFSALKATGSLLLPHHFLLEFNKGDQKWKLLEGKSGGGSSADNEIRMLSSDPRLINHSPPVTSVDEVFLGSSRLLRSTALLIPAKATPFLPGISNDLRHEEGKVSFRVLIVSLETPSHLHSISPGLKFIKPTFCFLIREPSFGWMRNGKGGRRKPQRAMHLLQWRKSTNQRRPFFDSFLLTKTSEWSLCSS